MDKRTFLKTAGLASLGATLNLSSLKSAVAAVEGQDPWQVAADEEFWRRIRGDYTIKPDYINLENGYYCFMPQETLEHQIQHLRRINYEGSYYMRTARQKNKRIVAAKVAQVVGCSARRVAITRNTTESLDLVIGGMDWQAWRRGRHGRAGLRRHAQSLQAGRESASASSTGWCRCPITRRTTRRSSTSMPPRSPTRPGC